MTRAEMDAEVARIAEVIGPEKSAHVVGIYFGAKAACGHDGPAIAEALTNSIIIHALGQQDPRGCIDGVVEMLRAGIDLFLYLRSEANAAKPPEEQPS